jgi:hypothetical protein
VPSGPVQGSPDGTPFAAASFEIPNCSLLILSDTTIPDLHPVPLENTIRGRGLHIC